MNLCRFFIWDVFFFGTARNIDSQISESNEGKFKLITGDTRIGNDRKGVYIWREKRKKVRGLIAY